MNVEIAGAAWVLPFALVVLALCAALILWRLFSGPTGPDRVVAIDALTLIGVGAIAVAALISGQAVVLDAAIVLAVVTFPGTVAFALLFRKGQDR